MLNRILCIIISVMSLFIENTNAFSLTSKFYDWRRHYSNTYNLRLRGSSSLVIMDYSQYKSFDDIINILPEFHSRIIINNWLKYVAPDENDNAIDYNQEETRDYEDEPQSNPLKEFPSFVARSLYDFKIFIAINREEKNTIYFGWCPDAKSSRGNIVYLVAGKVFNSTIYIERIAQNPYYIHLLDISSRELVERLQTIEVSEGQRFQFNYDRLHEYDPRYNISWNFYTTTDE